MRYIWNLYDEYFGKGRAGLVTRWAMGSFVGYLRGWDVKTAKNPHFFIANSRNVQQRIKQFYDRESDVIYPPVDTSLFRLSKSASDYFLIVSAFVPYKRIDVAIEAFNLTGDRLIIIGDGPDDAKLRSMSNPNIEFIGWQPDQLLKKYYAECRALIFPGEEDFGIVPVEAMASGKPVIAFARGGALETVLDSKEEGTGVLFKEQTANALIEALKQFRNREFQPELLRQHALAFDREVFKRKIRDFVWEKWNAFKTPSRQP
jgi:glycosyltransferase involved in cell wall biosynthesis